MDDEINFLKLIADETRFKILELLLAGEKCVCEIFPYVKRAQPTVSTHLNKLEETGILQSRRDGKKIFYKIKDRRVCEIFKTLGNNSCKSIKEGCCNQNE